MHYEVFLCRSTGDVEAVVVTLPFAPKWSPSKRHNETLKMRVMLAKRLRILTESGLSSYNIKTFTVANELRTIYQLKWRDDHDSVAGIAEDYFKRNRKKLASVS